MFENWCRSVVLLGVTILLVECADVSKPILTLGKHGASRSLHLRKRQINQQFSPQFFPFPTQPSEEEALFDQFRGPPRSQDEEDRFFALQAQRATTLNPLAFINPPRTTLSPIEQQRLEEQQRFQQEIADEGLREQQRLSLGVPRPPTTQPPPNVNAAAPFQFQESPLDQSQLAFPPNPSPVSDNRRQFAPPQSFAFVRTYHQTERRRKRAIDHRQSPANRLAVSPTRTYLGTLLQQPEPRRDIVTISNWLVKQLAKQIQKNLDHLTESTPTKATFVSTTTLPPLYATSPPTQASPAINLVNDLSSETENAKQWGNSMPSTTRDIVGTTTQTPAAPPYAVPQSEAIMISQEISSVPAAYATLVTPPSNVIYQSNVRSIPNVGPVLYSPRQLQPQYADTSKSAESPQFIRNDGVIYRVQPTVAAINPIVSDDARSTRMQNVQVLGTVPTPSFTVDQQNLYLPRKYQGSAFGGLKQLYDFDHPRDADIESNIISTSDRSNLAQRGTTVTSLFKTKLLNDYKNVDSYQQKDESERNRLAFQQPNRFFDLLQQSNSTAEAPFVNNESFNFDSVRGINGSKAAIFIRVPDEEQTSTRGYIFDKAIIAKSTNKKDYGSHKKYNRSPQVIKSSLVYRTPPGKKAATANRSEFAQSNLIPDDRAAMSNYFVNGTPILGFLRGNKRSTTTSRPFVTALFDYIQKRNVKKDE